MHIIIIIQTTLFVCIENIIRPYVIGERHLQILWISCLHRLKIQSSEPTAEPSDTYLFQNFGLLFSFLQQIFRVTCSFIKNGLSGKKKTVHTFALLDFSSEIGLTPELSLN